MAETQETHTASQTEMFYVERNPGNFASFLRAKRAFTAGNAIISLGPVKRGPKAYSTLQCGPGPEDHIEVASDLLYVNHSCEANIVFDMSSTNLDEWHVRAVRHIAVDDPLTHFYPSTEWEMAQPFDCQCGTPSCLGRIEGACSLSGTQLITHGFISPWIWTLRSRQDATSDVVN